MKTAGIAFGIAVAGLALAASAGDVEARVTCFGASQGGGAATRTTLAN